MQVIEPASAVWQVVQARGEADLGTHALERREWRIAADMSGSTSAIHVQFDALTFGTNAGNITTLTANSQTGFLEKDTVGWATALDNVTYRNDLKWSIRWPDGVLTTGDTGTITGTGTRSARGSDPGLRDRRRSPTESCRHHRHGPLSAAERCGAVACIAHARTTCAEDTVRRTRSTLGTGFRGTTCDSRRGWAVAAIRAPAFRSSARPVPASPR
jgi:hypothetical protein